MSSYWGDDPNVENKKQGNHRLREWSARQTNQNTLLEDFGNAKTIKLIKEHNKKVGISLKPKSKINLIQDYLDQIDLVLIMSVEPGFGGQKFMPEVLEKTKAIRNLINKKNLKVDVEIDGGINFENCSKAKNAGANILVSGSAVFKENQGDLKKNIEILRNN